MEGSNMEGTFGAATLEPKTPLDFHLKPEDGHPPCRRPRTCASAAGADVGLSQSNAMTGVAERRAGVPRAETGIGPSTGKLLDAEALQNIRKDLLVTQSAQLTRTERKAGLQARLNDVKSQALNPVAERRCLLQRHAGGNGRVDARGLVGLQNAGNTCFINTCVQCLSNLAPFGSFFLGNHHMFRLNKNSSMKGTLVLSFGELLHKLSHSAAFNSVSATTLRERIGKFAPQFTGCKQHDCQEFLRFLLDGLHEDMRCCVPMDSLLDIFELQTGYENAAAAQSSMIQYYESNFSQIISSFGGQLVSIVRCCTCGHTSHCFDPFLDLSLPLPEQSHVKEGGTSDSAHGECRQVDLLDCFETFCTVETLDGENMYMCSTCGCRCVASKQLRLVRCPPILVVHIKRFCYTQTVREKLVTQLSFAESGLDLTSFVVEGGGGFAGAAPIYDLKAMTLHSGGIAGGHYHALCCNSHDGQWYHYNDSSVTKTALADHDPGGPYILFYQLRDLPKGVELFSRTEGVPGAAGD